MALARQLRGVASLAGRPSFHHASSFPHARIASKRLSHGFSDASRARCTVGPATTLLKTLRQRRDASTPLLVLRRASTFTSNSTPPAASSDAPRPRRSAVGRFIHRSLTLTGFFVLTSGALVLLFFAYDASTYGEGKVETDVPVSEMALSPRRGGAQEPAHRRVPPGRRRAPGQGAAAGQAEAGHPGQRLGREWHPGALMLPR